VPPCAIPNTPVTSDARFTSALVTTPAVALRIPVSEPIERFEVERLVELAVVAYKLVVVAAVPVTPPFPSTVNKFVPVESCIWNRFATWLATARIVTPIAFVEVDCTETTEF
jgi:hypothetical protein